MNTRKSLVQLLARVIDAMFLDIKPIYTRSVDWRRDHSRLLHELEHRGVQLISTDLPALAKHFDKCLDQGSYTPSRLRYSRAMKGVQVPVFLRDLYLQIFDNEGKLRCAPNLDAIAALRFLLMGLKKLRQPYQERSVSDVLTEFRRVESQMRAPTLNWVGDDLLPQPDGVQNAGRDGGGCVQTPEQSLAHRLRTLRLTDAIVADPLFGSQGETLKPHLATIQQVADIVAASLGTFDEDTDETPKHGPGVVSDQKRINSKYEFRYWPEKLARTYPPDYYGQVNLDPWLLEDDPKREKWLNHELPSRLIVVPKTAKTPRLIASEPSQQQWIQQLIWNQLETRLEKTPIAGLITFRDQSRNQAFARKGSIGGFATIDLSNASDRLSCWLVERVFRSNMDLITRLHASRTRWVYWDGSLGIEPFWVRLRKFAPMGSAVTFPVQSIVYAICAVGVYLHLRGVRPSTASIARAVHSISVFGDDIIIPDTDCVCLMDVLTLLGLKVNSDKSYHQGHFRESCGHDYYNGVDVTPAYVLNVAHRASWGMVPAYLAQANNLFRKGWWHTAKAVDSMYDFAERKLAKSRTMLYGNVQLTFCSGVVLPPRRRYNPSLQRKEFLTLIPKGVVSRKDVPNAARLFQWFTERPAPTDKWEPGWVVRARSEFRPGWEAEDYLISDSQEFEMPLSS